MFPIPTARLTAACLVSAFFLTHCKTSTSQVADSDAATNAPAAALSPTSVYSQLWSQVKASPYPAGQLPHDGITLAALGGFITGSIFRPNAYRTLTEKADWLPYFDKLVRPNGICMTGTWQITKPSPYGGYFAQGSTALIIARGSVGFDETDVGTNRAFGMAGKLFPTSNPSDPSSYETANFFLIDDNGGSTTTTFMTTAMTNQPENNILNPLLTIAHKAALATMKVGQHAEEQQVLTEQGIDSSDASTDHSGNRQTYRIAQLGTSDPAAVAVSKSPAYLRISGSTPKVVPATDFRDELRPESYGAVPLTFDISVGQDAELGGRNYTSIGTITITEAVTSTGCDHQLHFHHPVWTAPSAVTQMGSGTAPSTGNSSGS